MTTNYSILNVLLRAIFYSFVCVCFGGCNFFKIDLLVIDYENITMIDKDILTSKYLIND